MTEVGILGMNECSHYGLVKGACGNCGLVLHNLCSYSDSYDDNTGPTGLPSDFKPDKNILQDLRSYDLPDEIKQKANRIFSELQIKTKKGKRRKLLMFFCIYNAYKESGIMKDPRHIADMVEIGRNEVSKALSQFSGKGYTPQITMTSPADLIPEYCEKFGLDENCTQGIVELCNDLLEKNPSLRENYPQQIAAAIIQFHLEISGIQFDKKEFSRQLQISDVTINNRVKEIRTAWNS